jgi:hypothetical protein
VRLHGGTVKASNRPKGGLQIEIRLPLQEDHVFAGDLARESRTEISKAAGESPATTQAR